MTGAKKLLAALAGVDFELFQKDFLLTWRESDENLRAVLLAAGILERLYHENISTRVFQSGLAVSCFRDNSTRTRFAFGSAANLLGLTVQDLDEGKSQIAHGETVRETANMVSFCSEVIGIRDDIFVGAGHEYMQQMSDAVEDGFRIGVLPQRPAVINLQCDRDHPTQSMADLLHLSETFGGLEHLRGKRIAMTWAYSPSYGKPLSVPQGIIALMTRFGMDVTLAHPPEYTLMKGPMECARETARKNGTKFEVVDNMDDAFRDADIVYPKSWGIESLFHKPQEALEISKKYKNWICDERKMTLAGKDAIYMHCLPADRGFEVTDAVIDGAQSRVFPEAENRLHTCKAVMALTM